MKVRSFVVSSLPDVLNSSFFDLYTHTATSAVDLETDKAIQEIIRGPQFENVTMLTIAFVSMRLFNSPLPLSLLSPVPLLP